MRTQFGTQLWHTPVLAFMGALGVFAALLGLGLFTVPRAHAADPTVTANPRIAGLAAEYTITFTVTGSPVTLPAFAGEIRLLFDKDAQVPTIISKSNVLITATRLSNIGGAGEGTTGTTGAGQAVSPSDAVVDFDASGRAEVQIIVPDMNPSDTDGQGIAGTADVTVTFTTAAGIKNPSEGDDDSLMKVTVCSDGTCAFNQIENPAKAEVSQVIKRDVNLSSLAGVLGTSVTVTGRGFTGGTTVTVWRDADGDGIREAGEIDLASAIVGSDDTFTAIFTMANPPFDPGFGGGSNCNPLGSGGTPSDCNAVNAVDGENNSIVPGTPTGKPAAEQYTAADIPVFELKEPTTSASFGDPNAIPSTIETAVVGSVIPVLAGGGSDTIFFLYSLSPNLSASNPRRVGITIYNDAGTEVVSTTVDIPSTRGIALATASSLGATSNGVAVLTPVSSTGTDGPGFYGGSVVYIDGNLGDTYERPLLMQDDADRWSAFSDFHLSTYLQVANVSTRLHIICPSSASAGTAATSGSAFASRVASLGTFRNGSAVEHFDVSVFDASGALVGTTTHSCRGANFLNVAATELTTSFAVGAAGSFAIQGSSMATHGSGEGKADIAAWRLIQIAPGFTADARTQINLSALGVATVAVEGAGSLTDLPIVPGTPAGKPAAEQYTAAGMPVFEVKGPTTAVGTSASFGDPNAIPSTIESAVVGSVIPVLAGGGSDTIFLLYSLSPNLSASNPGRVGIKIYNDAGNEVVSTTVDIPSTRGIALATASSLGATSNGVAVLTAVRPGGADTIGFYGGSVVYIDGNLGDSYERPLLMQDDADRWSAFSDFHLSTYLQGGDVSTRLHIICPSSASAGTAATSGSAFASRVASLGTFRNGSAVEHFDVSVFDASGALVGTTTHSCRGANFLNVAATELTTSFAVGATGSFAIQGSSAATHGSGEGKADIAAWRLIQIAPGFTADARTQINLSALGVETVAVETPPGSLTDLLSAAP